MSPRLVDSEIWIANRDILEIYYVSFQSSCSSAHSNLLSGQTTDVSATLDVEVGSETMLGELGSWREEGRGRADLRLHGPFAYLSTYLSFSCCRSFGSTSLCYWVSNESYFS